ncbi:uncharacterized protein PHA67_004934 isoform 2-T2 [Liasis olivaceus]
MLSSTSAGSTVSSMSVDAKSNTAITTNSPVIPIMESTFSSRGNIHITTTSDLNPFVFRDATESYSTPVFEITAMTNEMSASIGNTQTTVSAKDSKDAFPTNMSSNITGVPDDTMAGTAVPTTAETTTVSTEITVDPNSATTNRTDFPVPFTARGIHIITSNELTTDSDNTTANSTATPSITIKPSISVPTEVVVPSLNITPTLNETGGTLVPTLSTLAKVVVNRTIAADFNSSTASSPVLPSLSTDSTTVVPTTSLNVTAISDGALFPSTARHFNTTISSEPITDSNNTTISAPVLTTITLDSTTAVTTKTRAISFNVLATLNDTINETPIPYTAADGNVTPSVETTVASDSKATSNHTAFPSTATIRDVTSGVNVTIFHSPTNSINFTVGADTTTPRTSITSIMPSITRTSSEQLSTPPKHMPNATNPASVSRRPITITDKLPTAASKTTFHSQETSRKTAIPPQSSPDQTTAQAATSTQRSSSRAPPRTKPASHPTPNGYINIKPLSDAFQMC